MNAMTPHTPVTMSSREIAELTGKQHQHVKRDIEKMLKDLGEDASKFGHIYLDTRNREQTEYRLDRELTETLLLGYSAPLRRKVIQRLRELEEQVQQAGQRPITADDLIANPMQLLQIAQGYALKIEDMKREITVLQEDAEALERISGSDDLIGIRVAAKMLDMQERKFTDMIQVHKFAYRQVGSRHLLCYADKHKAGMCKNVGESFTKGDGSEGFRETLKFYPKGLVALAKKLNKDLTEGDIRAFLGKPRDGELPL